MSVRREVRLRKEFLQKKQQETIQQTRNEKKRQLQGSIRFHYFHFILSNSFFLRVEALDEGKSIPTELVKESRKLYNEMELDIKDQGEPSIDDEYAKIGLRDPKVCVTTSRDPSSKLKQFAKEIKLCIPNSQVVNRGTYRIDELVDACKKSDFSGKQLNKCTPFSFHKLIIPLNFHFCIRYSCA